MKGRHLVIGIALMQLIVSGCGPDWIRFDSEECGFDVLFPSAPEELVTGLETEAGTLKLRFYRATYKMGPGEKGLKSNFFYAYCADLPERQEREAIVARLEQKTLKDLNGRLVSRAALQVGSGAGTELLIEGSHTTYRTRILIAGGRLFAFVAGVDQLWPRSDLTFMESFRLHN